MCDNLRVNMEWDGKEYIVNVDYCENIWSCAAPKDKAAELLCAITKAVENWDKNRKTYNEEQLRQICHETKVKILGS